MANLLEELLSIVGSKRIAFYLYQHQFYERIIYPPVYLKSEGMKHASSDKQRASRVDNWYCSTMKVIVSSFSISSKGNVLTLRSHIP